MTATVTHTARISLEFGCCPQAESEFGGLFLQLAHGYDRCSVLELSGFVDPWLEDHRTARKRANRAERLGYRFEIIDRTQHEEDIFRINTSLEERQGRPMSNGYQTRQSYAPLPDYLCRRHRITTYGVLLDRHDIPRGSCSKIQTSPSSDRVAGGRPEVRPPTQSSLVAYLWLYRAGDLALVSSILGHGAALRDDVMYLLMRGTINREQATGGFLVYNRHDSGTDGLRYFKERCGFTEQRVEWLP